MTIRLFTRAALTALCLAVLGCGQTRGPIEVDRPGPEIVTVNGVDLLVAPDGLRPASGAATVTIGSGGGTLSIDGGLLQIPEGALGVPVEISMERHPDGLWAWIFGPSGLTFGAPATLVVQVDPEGLGVDPDAIAIAGASDAGDDWEVIGGTYDPETRTLTAPIEHFSVYGLCVE